MTCKICNKKAYSEYCMQHKPRKPLPLPKKPIKKRGKVANEWDKARAKWFRENPYDNFICYICGKYMTRQETTLDHVIPRSRAPHLRYAQENLQTCCWSCNNSKGSMVL